jgi:uncharacterized membrane protein YbhN (UPF0104 family)
VQRPCYIAAVSLPSASPTVFRWLRAGLGFIVALGVLVALYRIAQRWNGSDVHVRAFPLVLSAIILVVANFFQALGWKYLLERMAGRTVATRTLMTIFMSGQLARYTPGKVGLPMVRIAGATKLGLSAHLIAASVGLEVAAWIGVGSLVSCGSLLIYSGGASLIPGLSRTWIWLALLAIGSCLSAAALVDQRRFPQSVRRLLRFEGTGPLVSLRMLGMQLLAWFGWWVLGLLVPLAVGSSLDVAVSQAVVFILAPIIGFLALVAPGGLGVRETVISYALAPQIGASAALAAAVLARAAALVSELAGWLIAVVWERR